MRKGSYKPVGIQQAVIAAAQAGRSKRAIARDFGIHRNTVPRILDETAAATPSKPEPETATCTPVAPAQALVRPPAALHAGGRVQWRRLGRRRPWRR